MNCGRGGLREASEDVSEYAKERNADVVVLCETHMPVGEPKAIDGYELLWAPRVCMFGKSPAGGVAVAVTTASTAVTTVTVVEEFQGADVLWVRVDTAVSNRPLYVAAVYLPPVGAEHCCPGCGSPSCGRSHVSLALAYLAESAARFAAEGDVLLAGDFNVRAEQEVVQPRWRNVQDALLDEDMCVLANPVDGNGVLFATRCDPGTGRESVLDLFLTGVANVSVCVSEVGDVPRISDHYPMVAMLTWPAQEQQGGTFPDRYGFLSGVPSHLRQKPAVHLSRTADKLNQYRDGVDARLEALEVCGDDVEREVANIERLLLGVAYNTGLCTRERERDGAVRVFGRHQRELERARKQLDRTRETGGDVAPWQALVHRLEQRRAAELPQRRREQRRRRTLKRVEERAQLQRWWVGNETGLTARQMGRDQAGMRERRTRRPVVPLRVRQQVLWDKEQFLRKKYGSAPVVLGEFEEEVAEGDVTVPTAVEVDKALSQLNGNSAAIGVPLFPLKWARTDGLVLRLTRLMGTIWRSGDVPCSFGVVETVALPKPGSPDYRIIGVGSALSRLFRLIMYNRVLAQVRPLLDPMQFGFLPGRSTEHASFLSTSATRCVQAAGGVVETVFLDISGAYPTTPFDVVMRRFKDVGVPVDVRRLTHNYYRCQRMFVKVGRLVSGWVEVTIGLTEGDPMSPLTFIIVIDEGVRRLHSAVMYDNARLGIPMLDGTQLTCVWYADDGRLFAMTVAGMIVLLEVCEATFGGELRYKFNTAPTKSASMRSLPDGKAARRHAKQALQGTAPYTLQGKELPAVDTYKHVGVVMAADSVVQGRAGQVARLRAVVASIIRQVTTAPLRDRTLLYGFRLYQTYWWPRVSYAVGLYAEGPSKTVVDMESVVLRVLMSAANTPLVALRSVCGLPTLQTRFDMDRLRVLLRFLAGPPRDPVRQQLSAELAMYDSLLATGTSTSLLSSRKLWWHRTLELLAVMDTVCDAAARAQLGRCPDSWVAWARAAAGQWDHDLHIGEDTRLLARQVLLLVEHRRRRWELDRAAASLGEVRELLDTPNMAPFVSHNRRDLVELRVQLRGGRRVLFGHQFFHLNQCPHCTVPGMFTVPHLLRDCPVFEQQRAEYWKQAQAMLLAEGVYVEAADVLQYRRQWYLVTCGAAVPNTFLELGLDTDTHFARGAVPATRHLREAVSVYSRLLGITGIFLRAVVEQTRAVLAAGNAMWFFDAPAHAPRVTVNHRGREALALLQAREGEGEADAEAAEGMPHALVERIAELLVNPNQHQVREAVTAALREWEADGEGQEDGGQAGVELDVEGIVTALLGEGEEKEDEGGASPE